MTNPPDRDSGTDTVESTDAVDTVGDTDAVRDEVDDTDAVPDQVPAAARTVLDGPALQNEQMRRGTEDLRSSQDKIEQAREFADEVARRTDPEPPARPGDES